MNRLSTNLNYFEEEERNEIEQEDDIDEDIEEADEEEEDDEEHELAVTQAVSLFFPCK